MIFQKSFWGKRKDIPASLTLVVCRYLPDTPSCHCQKKTSKHKSLYLSNTWAVYAYNYLPGAGTCKGSSQSLFHVISSTALYNRHNLLSHTLDKKITLQPYGGETKGKEVELGISCWNGLVRSKFKVNLPLLLQTLINNR